MDYSEVITKVKPSIALVLNITPTQDPAIYSTGSGFIFHKEGVLVTCNHVVREGMLIKLKFPGLNDLLDASVILRDIEHDLALLKFEGVNRPPLEAFSGEVKEGNPVLFSGYPLTLFHLVSHQGILSSVTKDASDIVTYVIDGTVNSGNSGCPLLTADGKVIGVVNAKRRENSDMLKKVEEMESGAISLYGIDLVQIYRALIQNVQLGMGYAVPSMYIPPYGISDNAPPKTAIRKGSK